MYSIKTFFILTLPIIAVCVIGSLFFCWGEALSEFVRAVSPGCLSRRFFHLYCPGCGGTRAFCALVKGDFLSAIVYNFWWVPSFIILGIEYYDWAIYKLFPQRKFLRWDFFRRKLLIAYVIFTLGYMLARNIWRF